MTITTAKWSLDEYHRMIAAGILVDRQVELLKGEIIEMAVDRTILILKISFGWLSMLTRRWKRM